MVVIPFFLSMRMYAKPMLCCYNVIKNALSSYGWTDFFYGIKNFFKVITSYHIYNLKYHILLIIYNI